MTDSSTQGVKTILHPVSDLAKAKPVYTALLGKPPENDAPYYVGYEAEGQHIGLVPNGGPQGMTSPVAYWHVPDIEAKLAEVTAAGATVKDAPRDVGSGRLVASFSDPDGNVRMIRTAKRPVRAFSRLRGWIVQRGVTYDRGAYCPAPAGSSSPSEHDPRSARAATTTVDTTHLARR